MRSALEARRWAAAPEPAQDPAAEVRHGRHSLPASAPPGGRRGCAHLGGISSSRQARQPTSGGARIMNSHWHSPPVLMTWAQTEPVEDRTSGALQSRLSMARSAAPGLMLFPSGVGLPRQGATGGLCLSRRRHVLDAPCVAHCALVEFGPPARCPVRLRRLLGRWSTGTGSQRQPQEHPDNKPLHGRNRRCSTAGSYTSKPSLSQGENACRAGTAHHACARALTGVPCGRDSFTGGRGRRALWHNCGRRGPARSSDGYPTDAP